MWSNLKKAISDVIKTNGNQEITGALLQQVLISITNSVGANATFMGVATPSTNPGLIDGPVFYIASTQGVYPNFDGFALSIPGLAIIKNSNSGSWTGTVIYKTLQDFGSSEDFPVSQKFTTEQIQAITADEVYFDNKNLFNRNAVVDGWLSGVGTIQPNLEGQDYKTSEYINIEEQQSYIASIDGSLDGVSMRRVVFYDDSRAVLSYIDNVRTAFTTPEKAKYLRLSISKARFDGKFQLEKGEVPTQYDDYGKRSYKATADKLLNGCVTVEKLAEDTKSFISSQGYIHKNAVMYKRGPLSNGQTISLNANSVKTHKRLSFTGNLTSFSGSLVIGHGSVGSYLGSWLTINSTHISTEYYVGTSDYHTTTKAHGLTLNNKNKFSVIVQKETSASTASITIATESQQVSFNMPWYGDNGAIFVTSKQVEFSDCSLGWSCGTLSSDVWVFGDSYLSIDSAKRWPYYLLADGYSDLLLNAFSGENSLRGYADFENLIKLGCPKIAIWALGMNDKDNATGSTTSDTPNPNWLMFTQKFLGLCEKNNILPVLCTLPTVYGGKASASDSGISGFRYNGAKNAWVRNSGYDYIDFAKAVGADDTTGLWFGEGTSEHMLEGTQETDVRVHPTEYGAKALYKQAISDCPALMGMLATNTAAGAVTDVVVNGASAVKGGVANLGNLVKGLWDPIGGKTYTPSDDGTIQIPYAPLGGIMHGGYFLEPNELGVVTLPNYVQSIKTAFDDVITPDYGGVATLPLYVRAMIFNGVPTTPTSMGELVINAVTDVRINSTSIVNNGVANLGTLVKNITVNGTAIPNPDGTVNLGSVVTNVFIGGDTPAVIGGVARIGTYIGGVRVNGILYSPQECGGDIDLGSIGGSSGGIESVIINGNYAPKLDDYTVNLGTIPCVVNTEGLVTIGSTDYNKVNMHGGTIQIGDGDASAIQLNGREISFGAGDLYIDASSASPAPSINFPNGAIITTTTDTASGEELAVLDINNYGAQVNISADYTNISGKLILSDLAIIEVGENQDKIIITCGNKKAEILLN